MTASLLIESKWKDNYAGSKMLPASTEDKETR